MESKRIKKFDHENQDRIGGLPDHIIHHILSFLPSTKQAIQTTVLSKRWENQWTCVPVLIFDSTGISRDKFLKFIDRTLIFHDCSKINKFHLRYPIMPKKDLEFNQKVLFATRKHVEDLSLSSTIQEYTLPKSLFNTASLVQLTTVHCIFMPTRDVNWGCLTALILERCKWNDQAMDHIVSGSPLLKSLDITGCGGFHKLVIASKSLKRLVLKQPNISDFDIEISCPILEVLEISCLMVRNVKLGCFPSSLCATLDFHFVRTYGTPEIRKHLMKNILHQLQHVKELTIGSLFSVMLLRLACMKDLASPMLNIKCLTLRSTVLYNYPFAIPCVLYNTPHLERIVIIMSPCFENEIFHQLKPKNFEPNYSITNLMVFNCLVSHLKTIEINGLSGGDYDVVVNFVGFLLKNARVLEKMVINLKNDGRGFASKASQELLWLPRCSQDSIVELISQE